MEDNKVRTSLRKHLIFIINPDILCFLIQNNFDLQLSSISYDYSLMIIQIRLILSPERV